MCMNSFFSKKRDPTTPWMLGSIQIHSGIRHIGTQTQPENCGSKKQTWLGSWLSSPGELQTVWHYRNQMKGHFHNFCMLKTLCGPFEMLCGTLEASNDDPLHFHDILYFHWSITVLTPVGIIWNKPVDAVGFYLILIKNNLYIILGWNKTVAVCWMCWIKWILKVPRHMTLL